MQYTVPTSEADYSVMLKLQNVHCISTYKNLLAKSRSNGTALTHHPRDHALSSGTGNLVLYKSIKLKWNMPITSLPSAHQKYIYPHLFPLSTVHYICFFIDTLHFVCKVAHRIYNFRIRVNALALTTLCKECAHID